MSPFIGAARPQLSLTADEARRIAVHAQGLTLAEDRPRTVAEVLRRVGAVQLDTISVLARSHELVAYARLGAVGRAAVEEAYWGQPAGAFEYWAHANCVLPVEAWPYFAFRREQIARANWMQAWDAGQIGATLLDEIRARLRDGPLTVTDLGGGRDGTAGWWSWNDAKRALEALYYRGEVVCTARRNWKRVYDLPERALPAEVLGREPPSDECYRYLVAVTARARGVATARDLAAYFRLGERRLATGLDRGRLLRDAIVDNGLVPVEVEGWSEAAFATPAYLDGVPEPQHRPVLLSPFDSLIWADPPAAGRPNREYTQRLFSYAYSLEIYKPKQAREGYFTMPLLAGGRIAGHADPAREGRTLVARNILLLDQGAVEDMAAALSEAAAWVGCDDVRLERVQPPELAPALERARG